MAKVTKITQVETPIEKYEILAVSTNCDEFQFCTLLNQLLLINLQAQKPYRVLLQKKEISLHYFSAWDDLRKLKVFVVDNQEDGVPVVDFMRNINFFVKIVSPNEGMLLDNQRLLLESDKVTFVQRVNREKLTTKQNTLLSTLFDKM